MNNFNQIYNEISNLENDSNEQYYVPGAWIGLDVMTINLKKIEYFKERFNKIKSLKPVNRLSQKVVYNMLLRYTTSFPHSNGTSFDENQNNFNENGSILKAIALLPYIHSLGCNTLYLLPITSIGKVGFKGDLGSPYAIQNHYLLDYSLSEPFLNISIEMQFKALIEACHYLGINVVLEFVFRTASIDCDMALKFPDWFYWIKNDEEDKPFKPPFFTDEEIVQIKEKINLNDLKDLPIPNQDYINLFDTPITTKKELDGRIIGYNTDNERLIIPSAFADWPPDDNQPLWSDVTYLKLYNNDKFNYIAYNTIRMYDEELSSLDKNVELWNYLIGIIPYYQENYNIDGVMIDMGHALPQELRESIISKSREINSNFILWEENFALDPKSVEAGYNASLGYVCFDADRLYKMREIVKMLEESRSPIEFFLTPETHNTHRAASHKYDFEFVKMQLLVLAFLPGLQFIHSGIEFGEKTPVNTGLGFTIDEINQFTPDKLPLFSKNFMSFDTSNGILDLIKKINQFKIENNIDLSYYFKFELKLSDNYDNNLLNFILKVNNLKLNVIANFSEEIDSISLKDYENKKILFSTNNLNSFVEDNIQLEAFSSVVILLN